jgi:hypothetical protein
VAPVSDIKAAISQTIRERQISIDLFATHESYVKHILTTITHILGSPTGPYIFAIAGGAAWNYYDNEYHTTDIDVLVAATSPVEISMARYNIVHTFETFKRHIISIQQDPQLRQLMKDNIEDYSIQLIDKRAILDEFKNFQQLDMLFHNLNNRRLEQNIRRHLMTDPLTSIMKLDHPYSYSHIMYQIDFIRDAACNNALSNKFNPVKISLISSGRPIPMLEFTFTALDESSQSFKDPMGQYVPSLPEDALVQDQSTGLYYISMKYLSKKLVDNLKNNDFLGRYYSGERNISIQKLQSWKEQANSLLKIIQQEAVDLETEIELSDRDLKGYFRAVLDGLRLQSRRATYERVVKDIISVHSASYKDMLQVVLNEYCRAGSDLGSLNKNCKVAVKLWPYLSPHLVAKIGYEGTQAMERSVLGPLK